MKPALLGTLIAAGALSACHGELPVVGLDADGKPFQAMLKEKNYMETLSQAMTDLQDSTIPALDEDPARRMIKLHEVSIGLKVRAGGGIVVYKISGEVGFYLHFAND